MRRMAALLVALGTLGAGSARAADPRPLTLAETIAMAQKNAVAIVRAQGDQRIAAASVRSAAGAFLPSLSFTAGAARQLGGAGATRVDNGQLITVAPEPWSSSLGLGATATLFDGGERLFQLSQAKASRTSAQLGAESAKWSVTLAAKQAFFDVLAAGETQTAAAAQLDQAEQQRVAAIARTRAKTATRSDSLRAENQLRAAQLAVLQAEATRASTEAALARTIGSAEPVTATEPAGEEVPTLALSDEALAALIDQAPAVRAANADLAAAQAGKRISWASYLPSVTATWSRAGSGTAPAPDWGTGALDYAGSVRLALTFPLFDQFGREQRATQADVATKNADAALRDARAAAHQSLVTELGAFRTAGQQVVSQTASVAAAEEDLRVQRQRYAVGGSTLLDVLTSQTQLDQARSDLIRARYDQRVAKAQLEALVGREL